MNDFNPLDAIENSELILVEGKWPNFHDAEIHYFNYWKGDIRPEEDIWEGPNIEMDIELCALREPFVVKMKFGGCSSIKMSADNPDNLIDDLVMEYEERGFFTNGEPLPPYIVVKLKESFGFHLEFKCFHISVVERYEGARK